MSKLSVYQQLISNPSSMFDVIKSEIGVKTDCSPFANKAITALKTLGTLTQAEATNAANVFLDNLQTLNQGGIKAEDYDKIDFVKRGKTITISARVEAFYRAAARKGYQITDKIIGVPKEDSKTTYFREEFQNGEMVLILKDKRNNTDREITAERVLNGYFSKFICRLIVVNPSNGIRLMTDCEISNAELLKIVNTSEQGFFVSKWVEYKKPNGYTGKKKVVTEELNKEGFWYKWTGEMTNKTIIRRALKRVKEVLPELKEEIYAFEQEDTTPIANDIKPTIELNIPMETVNVDLFNLTDEQKAEARETLEIYKANPKLATDTANEIKGLLESGTDLQTVINTHYASIVCISKSKKTFPIIAPWFESMLKGGGDSAKD